MEDLAKIKTINIEIPDKQEMSHHGKFPVLTYGDYGFFRICNKTIDECAHVLAEAFTTHNPVHKYLGISYEEDFIYYRVIIQRAIEDNLGFYLKKKDNEHVLIVNIGLDLFHYQQKPLGPIYFPLVPKNSGLHKLRGIMSTLKSMEVIKAEYFGQYAYFYCSGVRMKYVTKFLYTLADYMTYKYFDVYGDYQAAVGETLTIITENNCLKHGYIVSDVLFTDYVYVDGTKPLEHAEKFAETLNQKNTKRACCFVLPLKNKAFKASLKPKF